MVPGNAGSGVLGDGVCWRGALVYTIFRIPTMVVYPAFSFSHLFFVFGKITLFSLLHTAAYRCMQLHDSKSRRYFEKLQKQ